MAATWVVYPPSRKVALVVPAHLGSAVVTIAAIVPRAYVYTAPRRTGDKLEANKHSHLLALGLLGEVAVEQEEEAVHLGAHDL